MPELEIEIKLDFLRKIKKHWTFLALIIIFLLSFSIRLSNFHWPYLLNIDSYFHYRYMKYIAEGRTEALTIERNGELIQTSDLKYDPLMTAPNGKLFNPNPYHYIGAYSYLFVKLFFPYLELWRFLIYFPVFITSLMVIPAYILGKTIYDKKAGVLAAFLILFNPAIMSRTVGGDPDNDCWVLLLPLTVLALYFLAYKNTDGNLRNKKAIIYSFLAGLFFTIFAYSWVSWYIFYLILGFCVVVSILGYITKKIDIEKIKHIWLTFVIFFLTFVLISFSISGTSKIYTNLIGPFQSLKLKSEVGQFPNVYVSVAEMMSGGSLKTVAQRTGTLLFFLGFLSLIYLSYSYLMNRKHLEALVLLGLWIIAPLYASLVAIRFTILLALPLSLATAILLSRLWGLVFKKEEGES